MNHIFSYTKYWNFFWNTLSMSNRYKSLGYNRFEECKKNRLPNDNIMKK